MSLIRSASRLPVLMGAVFSALTLNGCSAPPSSLDPRSNEATSVVTLETRRSLPRCNGSTFGEVYYIANEAQFVYCDGQQVRPLDAVAQPGWWRSRPPPPAIARLAGC